MKTNFDEYFETKMKDLDFRAEYALHALGAQLAYQIRETRECLNMQQEELALVLGTGQSRISQMENPLYCKFTLQSLARVAEALNCSLEINLKKREMPCTEMDASISDAITDCWTSLQTTDESEILSTHLEVGEQGYTTANNIVKLESIGRIAS